MLILRMVILFCLLFLRDANAANLLQAKDYKIILEKNNVFLTDNAWARDSESFRFFDYNLATTDSSGKEFAPVYEFKIDTSKVVLKNAQPGGLINTDKQLVASEQGDKEFRVTGCPLSCKLEIHETSNSKNYELNVLTSIKKQLTILVPTWSPDANWIAFLSPTTTERLMDVFVVRVSDTVREIKPIGQTHIIATEDENTSYINWSQDNRRFYTKDSFAVFSIDPVKELYRPQSPLLQDVFQFNNPWKWSSDSRHILAYVPELVDPNCSKQEDIGICDLKINVYVIDTDTGDTQKLFIKHGSFNDLKNFSADFSPDRQFIVYAEMKSLFIMNIQTKTATKLTKKEDDYSHPSWSHDGKKIIFNVKDKGVGLITVE
ncbi:MAG: PD40 domain-containing protein [Deltaproteobacteria bacterium]|nr:PD40 domain-containing protein [Deltaproteobacteria bacterium]